MVRLLPCVPQADQVNTLAKIPLSTAMLPLIPVEVWERVIDELSIHLTTLWSCALVCKAWQARSRFHLISRVTLTNRQQIYRLARLLDEHPELRTRVQTVHLRPEMLAGPMMHLTGFASMLAKKLPAVTSLWLFHSKWMPNTAQNNTFLHLSSFSSLLELSLRGVTFSSPLILARLICSFPNLGSVQLVEISVQNRVFDLLQLPTTLPPVRKIKLDGPSEDIADLLALHLGVAAGVEQFFGGWADFKEDVLSDSAIMTILRASGPTLQQVSLRLWGTPKTAAEQTEYADTDGAAGTVMSDTRLSQADVDCSIISLELVNARSVHQLTNVLRLLLLARAAIKIGAMAL